MISSTAKCTNPAVIGRAAGAYAPRLATDCLFQLPAGSSDYSGILDETARYIQKIQLTDPALWKKFVDQFRSNTDDADNGWRCEYWGKMMRGACFTYAYTQDQELYKILEETVRDLMTAQDSEGRITSYSKEAEFRGWDIWGRKYILLALQYFIEICPDESLIKEIIAVMRRHADYMLSKLGREEDGKLLITKATSHWHGLNSSSVLEPFVRLYTLTGERKYLDFSTYIVDCGGTSVANIFELAYEGKLYPYQYPVVKAYEMMSCFEGLLEYYRVTGIEKWKTAVVNFAHLVLESDITIIGCAGCTHELFDHSAVRQLTTEYLGIMQETCVTVTWMKLCYQMLGLTGDPVFADAIEQSAYNALLGAVNTEGIELAGGLPFDSYSPLILNTRCRGVGGKKIMSDGSFYGCCACIGSAGTALPAMAGVMTAVNGIAVNLYQPGTVRAYAPSGAGVALRFETGYPVNGNVEISVEPEQPELFTVYLRIPGWSARSRVTVNGAPLNGVTAGSYTKIERVWSAGDRISLTLDMTARLIYPPEEKADKNSGYHIALKRGPLVLARDARLGEIKEAVEIAADEFGEAALRPDADVPFAHLAAYYVPRKNGGEFPVVDYSSAGKTWDKTSLMTAWMPTKEYWNEGN